MKGVIIYKGRYGATAQYAKWIADTLHFPVYEGDAPDNINLNEFDCVVAGTSVYIGKMLLANWIRTQESILSSKKLFLFVVCGTPLTDITELNNLLKNNISPALREKIKVFFLHGRLIKRKLSVLDRLGLQLGAWLQKDKTVKQRMLTDYDDVRQENLKEMLSAIRAESFVIA